MDEITAGRWLKLQYRDSRNLTSRQRLYQTSSAARVPWHQFVFGCLTVPHDCRILEVGCGPAAFWVDNASRIPASWQVTLTDQSPGMVSAARSATTRGARNIRVQKADVANLPFPDGGFEAVMANHMLYHVAARPRALSEIARVLVPGGLLVAATNGPRHLLELRALVRAHLGSHAWVGASASFDLQNAPDQLRPWFAGMMVRRHRSRLLIKDPQLVLDYLSSLSGPPLPASAKAEIRQQVSRAIADHGHWEVHPEAGVILARRRRRLPS
ncbi:MAG: class I SAM-dependent methyltransferase [Candidatus Dormibacteria bacterium]